MAESVEHRLPVRKIGSLNHSRIKTMTSNLYWSLFKLALCLNRNILGYDNDSLAQYQDIVNGISGHGTGGLVSQ